MNADKSMKLVLPPRKYIHLRQSQLDLRIREGRDPNWSDNFPIDMTLLPGEELIEKWQTLKVREAFVNRIKEIEGIDESEMKQCGILGNHERPMVAFYTWKGRIILTVDYDRMEILGVLPVNEGQANPSLFFRGYGQTERQHLELKESLGNLSDGEVVRLKGMRERGDA